MNLHIGFEEAPKHPDVRIESPKEGIPPNNVNDVPSPEGLESMEEAMKPQRGSKGVVAPLPSLRQQAMNGNPFPEGSGGLKGAHPILKAEKDKNKKYTGNIYLDSRTKIEGIPPQAFSYKLGHSSPIEWVLKQHAPKSPSAKDKQNYAKIFEKFNTPENEQKRYLEISRPYLLDLIPRLVTVSLETLRMREEIRGMGE